MEQNDLSMVNFNSEELRDITSFCKLNELDVTEFIKSCFDKGYQIEKYGLLTVDGQAVIEKEVIKEVPVEVIREKIVEVTKEVEVPIEVIKEVVIEKPVEVIKEVIVEKPVEVVKEVVVEKEIYVNDDTEINELLLKIQQLENKPPETIEKEIPVEKIVEVEKVVEVIKEVEVINKEKQKLLQDTIQKLREEIRKKDESILQLEKSIVELKETQGPVRGQFMRSSNLNDNLYR